MGSLVPRNEIPEPNVTPYLSARAAWLQRRVEFEVFRHGLLAAAGEECDRQDREAAAEAVTGALDAELKLLDWGMHRANGSAAKAELVARRVNHFVGINDTRLTKNYGR